MMAGTARLPLRRPVQAPQITSRAVELFAALERARRAGRWDEWEDWHDELHRELRLRPWQWPCVPRDLHPRIDDEQQMLWDRLSAALKAARRVAKGARNDVDVAAD